MSAIVQIQGERPVFPGNACVNCLKPAEQQIEIVRVKDDGTIRSLSVPFCDECVALRHAKSSRQAQFERLATVSSLLLSLTVSVCVFTFIQGLGAWFWGVLLGLLVGLILFGLFYMLIPPWMAAFRLPETKAALRAATIREFDWDTTIIEFSNEIYAERFSQVNRKE